MNGDVQLVPDEEGREIWKLITDDDTRDVSAERINETTWRVTVDMMLSIREEPLEGMLRRRITHGLQSVSGTQTVEEEDREDWLVTGAPSPAALILSAALAVDTLTTEIEEAFQYAVAAKRERRETTLNRMRDLIRPRKR